MANIRKKVEIIHRSTRDIVDATPSLKSVVAALQNMIHKQAKGNLLFYHEVGATIEKVSLDPDTYGDDAVDRIADQLKVKEQALRDFQRVYKTFPVEQLEAMAKRAVETGVPITLTHLLHLATISKSWDRSNYLKCVFAYGWSANDLRREIWALEGPKNKPGAGRPPKRPTSPEAGYSDVSKFSKSMITRFDSVWREVFEEVDQTSPEHLDEELLSKCDATDADLAALEKEVQQARRRVAGNKERIAQVIERRKASETPSEELDEDPFEDDDEGWAVD